MKIRKATKRDIKETAKLMLKELKKPPFNEKASINSVLKSLDFYFKIGKSYVAIVKKKIKGVILFKVEQYWEGPAIIIEDLVVDNKFKKQGFGKTLINKVEDYAKKNKVKLICFKTHKKSPAVKFYQKQKYKIRKDVLNFEKKV